MRPQRTHLEVVRSELQLSGAMVVDVGCGAGALSHLLAEEGARIVGVDPSADAIARAVAGAGPRERYLVGFAEDLPVPERYADAVTFLNSLHHVSTTALPKALTEAGRVLRKDGIVYVQEPLAEGRYFEVVRLLEDETGVRAAAQRALQSAHRAGLEVIRELEYDALVRHRDFAAFRDRMLLTGRNRESAFAAHASEVEERFHHAARRDRNGWSFLQPTRVTLLGRHAPTDLKTKQTNRTKGEP
ncbi:MAG: class I SAM-dependent methyltransferase [Solirubrobacteraceae bacterium]